MHTLHGIYSFMYMTLYNAYMPDVPGEFIDGYAKSGGCTVGWVYTLVLYTASFGDLSLTIANQLSSYPKLFKSVAGGWLVVVVDVLVVERCVGGWVGG